VQTLAMEHASINFQRDLAVIMFCITVAVYSRTKLGLKMRKVHIPVVGVVGIHYTDHRNISHGFKHN